MKLKQIILTIVLLQASLCTIEAVRSFNCYESGSECWSWFFAFVANIPASVVFEQIFGAIVGSFGIKAFAAQIAIRFGVYLLGGTLWWVLIVLLIRRLVSFFKKRSLIGDRPQK